MNPGRIARAWALAWAYLTGAIDDLNRRERAGDFLPQGQVVRGGGYMGPRAPDGRRLLA
jgi:hypothetical protein